MRFLYLDDSGKTDPNHSSRFVVYGGLTVRDRDWHDLNKRITGAKAKFYPARGGGRPNEWELKTADFLNRNPWQRKRNRDFCFELVRILKRSRCSVYAVAAEKARAARPLDETWLVPLIFQRITAKYIHEISARRDGTGTTICDWTSYKLDHHISKCVQSYAISRGYSEVIGGVSYGSSASTTAIQAADLIAGAFRIWHEGGRHLDPLITDLRTLQHERAGTTCVEGYPMVSVFKIF